MTFVRHLSFRVELPDLPDAQLNVDPVPVKPTHLEMYSTYLLPPTGHVLYMVEWELEKDKVLDPLADTTPNLRFELTAPRHGKWRVLFCGCNVYDDRKALEDDNDDLVAHSDGYLPREYAVSV